MYTNLGKKNPEVYRILAFCSVMKTWGSVFNL